MKEFEAVVEGEKFILDPQKAIYWIKKRVLIVSDLHFGKAGHFRKHGIPVPSTVHHQDVHRLDSLIRCYRPHSLFFLGDLFHSEPNGEWDLLSRWMSVWPGVTMRLIRGNHDILPEEIYKSSRLELCDEWIAPPFHFSHEEKKSELYNISGHVHPAIRLKGTAKQGFTVPCFYFGKNNAFMPAFGGFTGYVKLNPSPADRVYALADGQIIALKF